MALLVRDRSGSRVKWILVSNYPKIEKRSTIITREVVSQLIRNKSRSSQDSHNHEHKGQRTEHAEVKLEANTELTNFLDVSWTDGKALFIVLSELGVNAMLASDLSISDLEVHSFGQIAAHFEFLLFRLFVHHKAFFNILLYLILYW